MGLRASWTTREYDMGFEARGRRDALRDLKIDPKRLVCPSQVHGGRVAAVGAKERGRGAAGRGTALPETDALITATPGTILSIQTADCLPVFLAAPGRPACPTGRRAWPPGRQAVGLIHAGWRGLKAQIVDKTVRTMIKRYGVSGGGLVAVLGPAIRPCCYEVSDDFRGIFPDATCKRQGKVYLDLAAEAARQLTMVGVSPDRIFDSKLCTFCAGQLFYSYRRDRTPAAGMQGAGRSMSILEILGS